MLKITLTSGLIGKTKEQRRVVTALGLGKYGSSVVRHDSPTIRGMCNKISHLLTVTEGEAKEATTAKTSKKETKFKK